MFSGFQSNAYQNNAYQILRGSVTPYIPPDGGVDDVRRYKKYLKDLKAYQQSKIKPEEKKRKKVSKKIKRAVFEPIPVNFGPQLENLEALRLEIERIELLIVNFNIMEAKRLALMRERDDEEAFMLMIQ